MINLYPLYFPRFYYYLRTIILPFAQLEQFIPKKGKILDVGCGYGPITLYLSQNPLRQIQGTDINKYRIDIASTAAKSQKNLKFSVVSLIKPNNKFDCILAVDLIHHLTPVTQVLFFQQALKALDNHGLLVIKDIDPTFSFKYLFNYLHDLISTRFSRMYYLSTSQMLELATQSGFKFKKMATLEHPLYPHLVYIFHV